MPRRHLLLQADRGAGTQDVVPTGAIEIAKQDRRGVDVESVADALEQLVQQRVERKIGECHVGDLVEVPQRFPGGLGDLDAVLELVHVDQHHDGTVDLVLLRPVGLGAQDVAPSRAVADVELAHRHGVDHLDQHAAQVGDPEIEVEIRDRTSHVGRQEVQDPGGGGRRPSDAQIAAHHDDRQVDARQEVAQVVRGLAQLGVPDLQLARSPSSAPRWSTGAPPSPSPAPRSCSAAPRCSRVDSSLADSQLLVRRSRAPR